jgi:hypothetical protein
MGTLTSHTTPDSMTEVAKLLQRELHRLSLQDHAIRRRVRNLRRVLRGLHKWVGRAAGYELDAELHGNSNGQRRVEPDPGQPATVLKCSIGNDVQLPDIADHSLSELRRACRIALMEADQACSAEEIYTRILRRRAFSFNNLDHAVIAIVQALNVMTKDGETCCVEIDSRPCWKRTVKEAS